MNLPGWQQTRRQYPQKMANYCCCRRLNRPAKLEPQSLPGTGTSSPFFSVSLSSRKPSGGPHNTHAGRSRSKSTLICVSGINRKSKPRWLVGPTTGEESCPPIFRPGFSMGAAGTGFDSLWLCDRGGGLTGRTWRRREPNLDLQAALWPIAGLDCPTVKPNCALGDGQPKADPSGLTAAGVVDAIERAEKLVKLALRYTWAGIHDPDHGFRSSAALAALQRDLHTGALPRVASGVADNIFNR